MAKILEWNRQAPVAWILPMKSVWSSIKRRKKGFEVTDKTGFGGNAKRLIGRFKEQRGYYPQ